MLPSMRYETRKLSELYHRKQNFRNHRLSVVKIKNKSNNNQAQRSLQINQLKNKMHNAYNYTQKVRGKNIKQQNYKLFVKCFCGRNSLTPNPESTNKQKSINKSLDSGWKNPQENVSPQKNENLAKSQEKKKFLLRNHRNYPISKLTNYDRTKQNLRLAGKINKPCPHINTDKLQKVHEQAKRYKQRIMKYNDSTLKSERYLEKRLSSTFNINKDRSTSRSFDQKMANSSGFYMKRNSIIFKKDDKDEKNPFALTEYQQ